ncbi:MAG TPA: hypothetical protein VFK57_20055 [Vicinamibacterales bacterium]|nr:hypothetical protein [Vicinamibacterales bacterium]
MPLSHSRIAILADTRQAAGCQPDRLEPSSRSPPASRKAASWHVRGNVVHRIDSKSSGGDSGLTQAACVRRTRTAGSSPEVAFRERAAGSGFQVALEIDRALLICELDRDHHFPGSTVHSV